MGQKINPSPLFPDPAYIERMQLERENHLLFGDVEVQYETAFDVHGHQEGQSREGVTRNPKGGQRRGARLSKSENARGQHALDRLVNDATDQ